MVINIIIFKERILKFIRRLKFREMSFIFCYNVKKLGKEMVSGFIIISF